MSRFRLRAWMRETFPTSVHPGFRLCGMDEVGRGALAGPLVAAAVVLPPAFRHPQLRDSKRLTARQREAASAAIWEAALACEVVEIDAVRINRRGIGWANKEVFRLLVDRVTADGYCSDGNLRIAASHPVHCLVKGDDLVPAISAASIVAKVHRDALMTAMAEHAPQYGWERNKGYGAQFHRDAILEHGVHPEHRTLFIRNLTEPELPLDLNGMRILKGTPQLAPG